MMKRRIFLWVGFGVLFTTMLLCRAVLAEEIYCVRLGDTLSGIAMKHGIPLKALKRANHLNSSILQIDQILLIPSSQNKTTVSESSKNMPKPDSGGGTADNILLSQEVVMAELETKESDPSSLLGEWSNPDEQKLLVKVAMGFLGAPYRLGGSSVKGIDCSGFVKKIYEIFNIELPRTAYEQSHIGMRVKRSELVEGDLLFFRTKKPVGHVGIYIGNNEFVHACSRKKGVRVDSLSTSYYNQHFIRAVRLKGSNGNL